MLPSDLENLNILMRVQNAECRPRQFSRQMTRRLHRLGYDVGRKRVCRLMATTALRAIYQKPRTTIPHPDTANIPMRRGFLYLVVITDWSTRKVLA